MFIENPNITVNNGVYAATLFVYASFIFVASATFAVPYIFEGPVLRNTCIVSVLAVTATSGRSALLISCIIGVILRIFFRKFRHTDAKYQKEFSIYRLLIFAFSLISAIGFLYYFINVTSGVDISYTFETIYRKIGEGGGEERRDQWLALWNGIRQTSGLGAGHGVGVDLVRSDQYPWRYELFPVAMIYRVGVIGFALMMMPYFIYVIRFLKAAVKHNVTLLDSFMFAGFLGMFAASTTNPYPESFIYQWMLIGPMVLFEEYHSNFMRSRKV